MAVNVTEEMKRPFSLGLASVALIGWLLALCVWAYYTAQLSRMQDRLADAQGRASQFAVTLQQERSAAGTLAEIESKALAAKDLLAQSTQARADVESDLAQLQKDAAQARLQVTGNRTEAAATTKALAELRVQEAQAREDAAAAAKSLADLQGQVRSVAEQLAAMRVEQAKADQDRAARTKAFEDLSRQVAEMTARRDKLVEEIAAAAMKSTDARAELAKLEAQAAKSRAAAGGQEKPPPKQPEAR